MPSDLHDVLVRRWRWMRATGGWRSSNDPADRRYFHAYDDEHHMACEPILGLSEGEPANEGSELCPECMSIVWGFTDAP